MHETMYDCYQSQFACMGRILAKKDVYVSGFAKLYRQTAPTRLYLIGSGSSFNACAAARPVMEQLLGIEVTALAPTQFGKAYGERPLAIVLSQGGHSTNTIAVIQQLKKQGVPVVTLTDPADTPVGQQADLSLPLAVEDEQVGPKTRGYSGSIFTLYLLALEGAQISAAISDETYRGYLTAMAALEGAGRENQQRVLSFYQAHKESLKKAAHYVFIGKGQSAQIALEDTLKILETLCFPASGYEFEEALHGPLGSIGEKTAVFFFLADGKDEARMLKTAQILAEVTDNCYVISHNPQISGDQILYLPADQTHHLAAFADVLFGQLISALLTEEMGRKAHLAIQRTFTELDTKAVRESWM